MYCHGGCGVPEVLSALGLGMSELFDTPPARPADSDRRPWTPSPRASTPKATDSTRQRVSPEESGRGPRRKVAVHPYADADGRVVVEVVRWSRASKKGGKYTLRREVPGKDKYAYSAPPVDQRVLYMLPLLRQVLDASGQVWLCEGEKDADALNDRFTAEGVNAAATTNLFGATASGEEQRKWLPSYTATLAGADVVICVDGDDAGNDYAGQRHALYVAGELQGAGCRVRLAGAAAGKDPYDHLAAGHGLEEFTTLDRSELAAMVAAHDTATAPQPATPPAEPAEPGKVLPFRRQGEPDTPETPEPEREKPRKKKGGSGGGGSGGGMGEVRSIVVRDQFGIREGSLCRLKQQGSGEDRVELATELIPGVPRLLRRLRYDLGDGERCRVTHRDLEASYDGQTVVLEALDDKEWSQCSWVDELPWPAPITDTSTGRAMLRKGIMATSGQVPVETMYGRLGWWEINGEWVYLHAAGALSSAGVRDDVRVHVDKKYEDFWLPEPVHEDAAALREAALSSLNTLGQVPIRLAAPMLCAAWRACLGYSSTTVLPVGGPSSGKTALAALGQQHYAPRANYEHLPFGAGEDQATVASLEYHRYVVGDMLAILDDAAPDRGTEALGRRQNQLARSQFNRRGRDRGKREGGNRAEHPPNGLLGMTTEQWVGLESAETRIVPMPMYVGELDPRAVFGPLDAPGEAENRARLTASMAAHYAPTMPMTHRLREVRAHAQDALIDPEAAPGVEARRCESFADLWSGAHFLLDMLVERGAFTAAEAAGWRALVWEGLCEAKQHMGSSSEDRRPHLRAAELLRSAFLRKDAALVDKNTQATPAHADMLGWETLELGSGDFARTQCRRVGTPIGWVDGEYVYLNPIAATETISRAARGVGVAWHYTHESLGQSLGDAGVIDTERSSKGRRNTVRVRIDNQRIRVWKAPLSWVFPPDDEGEDPDDGGGDILPDLPPDLPPSSGDAQGSTSTAHESETPVAPAETDDEPQTATSAAESASETAAPSSAGERPQQPGQSAERSPRTQYAAPGVVCDAEQGWLARPEPGEALPLPAGLDTPAELGRLLDWAYDELELGLRPPFKGARHRPGQVWVTPALRGRLHLPSTLAVDPDAGKENRTQATVRRLLESAGWQTAGRIGVSAYTTIYREGGRRMHLVVPEWLEAQRGGTTWGEDDPDTDPRTLARRLGLYARLTGTSFLWSPGVSGVNLVEHTRPKLLETGRPDLPPPARAHNRELPYEWQRAPQGEESSCEWVHCWDVNAMYLGATASLRLGYGAAVRDPEARFDLARDRERPGFWKIRNEQWDHARLPDPLRVLYRSQRDTIWVSTPSLRTLVELYEMEPEILDAYVWEKTDTGRVFDKWSKQLRGARQSVLEHTGDPDAAAVEAAVKGTYSNALGRLAGQRAKANGHRLYRPDWRHHVIAQARYALTRRLLAVAESFGMYPLAIATDAVVYASSEPDPAKAIPTIYDANGQPCGGLIDGTGLGQVKHVGTRRLDDVAPLLRGSDELVRTTFHDDGTVRAYGLMDLFKHKDTGGEQQ